MQNASLILRNGRFWEELKRNAKKKKKKEMNNVWKHSELLLNLRISWVYSCLSQAFSLCMLLCIRWVLYFIMVKMIIYLCRPKNVTFKFYSLRLSFKLRHENTRTYSRWILLLFLIVTLALFKCRIFVKTKAKNIVWKWCLLRLASKNLLSEKILTD